MTLCKHIAALVCVCLLAAGCYESKYPLATSDAAKIDSRLLKSWVEQQPTAGDKPYRAMICKFSEKEYLVVFSSDNTSATAARAYTTMVDGVPVLTLQGIESEKPADRTFVFFKYAFSADGSLQTWMLSSDSPLLKNAQFSSQAAFAAYIKKHIHDERLFGPLRRFKPAGGLSLQLSP